MSAIRLVYLVEEKQLTKGPKGTWTVISMLVTQGTIGGNRGKTFSHWRSELPSERLAGSAGTDERTGEFQTDEVVALPMLHAQDLGAQVPRDPGEGCQCR